MNRDIFIGLDASTTSAKAVAWDAAGRALGEGRRDIPLSNPAPGRYEQNPEDWWRASAAALKELSAQVDLSRAAALAISNQRETVGFFTRKGESVHPAIVWLDERCADAVAGFADEVGADSIHEITGKHPDITPVVYRLAWLRDNLPEVLKKTEVFADAQAALVFRLTGEFATSWTSADPMGYWDIRRREWSAPILAALGIPADRFPRAERPGALLGEISPAAAAETGVPAGTPVAAGGGDGQCAGLGADVIRPGAAYLNIGTAIVFGAHQSDYARGDAWRTMTAMTGDGFIMESCLRSGAFLLNWLVCDIFGLSGAADDFAELEKNAARLPPGGGGELLLPHWSGAMNPHWDSAAKGAIAGLSGGTRREHLYRAALEGAALDQAMCAELLEKETGVTIEEFRAVGGGAQSDLWCQIFADAAGKNIRRLDTVEASALGAGMSAAAGCGFFPSLPEAAAAMRGKTAAMFRPRPECAGQYRELAFRHRRMYPALRGVFHGN